MPRKAKDIRSRNHPAWEDFEKLIATIHTKSCKGAIVTHNRFVQGKTGRRRQIDVSIQQPTGLYEMLIVVECKRKTRPVEIREVEAFVTKLKDVSASKGVMVAPAGFDEGAKACAAQNDIKLLSYREASEADWNFDVRLTAVRFVPDWIKAFFGNDSGLVDVALETCVSFEGVEEPVTLRTLIEPLLQELVNSQLVGQVIVEADLRPPAVLPNGVNLTFMRAETYLRAFECLPDPLKLADGHVLMDSSLNVPQVSSLHSASIDTEHLFQQHGRELTQEELERVRATSVATAWVRNPKRFVRVHASVTAKA